MLALTSHTARPPKGIMYFTNIMLLIFTIGCETLPTE